MNKKQVLELLEREASDEDVRVAVDWLKKRKSSSPAAWEVLHSLLNRKQFVQHLPWLTEWLLQDGANFSGLATSVSSFTTLDWFVEFLNAHPEFAETGISWHILLMRFWDHAILDGATNWLVRYDETSDVGASVAASILNQKPTDEVLTLSKDLYKKYPDHIGLLLVLGEHTRSAELQDTLVHHLETGDPYGDGSLAAEALLEIDERKYQQQVIERYRTQKPTTRASMFISSLSLEFPEVASILAIEWIRKHPSHSETPDLIEHMLLTEASAEFIELASEWITTRTSEEDLPGFLWRLSTGTKRHLPASAFEFTLDWLQKNKNSTWWIRVAEALLRHAQPEQQEIFVKQWSDNVSSEQNGRLLLACLAGNRSSDSISKAADWVVAFPESHIVYDIVGEMLKSTDRESSRHAISLANRFGIAKSLDLPSFIKHGDQKSVEEAKQWLDTRYVEWLHNGSVHGYRLEILEALLTANVREPWVAEHAEKWLTRKPYRWQRNLNSDFHEAYEKYMNHSSQLEN
jgi:hypothetical protein